MVVYFDAIRLSFYWRLFFVGVSFLFYFFTLVGIVSLLCLLTRLDYRREKNTDEKVNKCKNVYCKRSQIFVVHSQFQQLLCIIFSRCVFQFKLRFVDRQTKKKHTHININYTNTKPNKQQRLVLLPNSKGWTNCELFCLRANSNLTNFMCDIERIL